MVENRIKLQPIVQLNENCIFGYEALYNKCVEEDYPGALTMMEKVFAKCHPSFEKKIFLNMTVEEIADKTFCNRFLRAMEQQNINGKNVVLEINEATPPDLLIEAKQAFSLLRTHNISVALDDFGTYYSGFLFLHEIPVDIVKLDKKFVQNVPHSKKARTLLKACVSMSHDLDYEVVAEGIETQDQLECIKTAGVKFGQGFLFTVPQSIPYLHEKSPFADVNYLAQCCGHLAA
jgi:EAL domain-containing protein (putative c-di-GMP-specific phosphodiesterase class I)